MNKCQVLILLVFGITSIKAQITTTDKGVSNVKESPLAYARNITKTLCSPEYHGRGYVQDGCRKAAKYLLEEFQRIGLTPVNGSHQQTFDIQVNTFPNKCKIRSGFRRKKPGIHYLLHPSSAGYHGNLKLKVFSASDIMNYRFGSSWDRHAAIAFIPDKQITKDSLKLVRKKLEKIARTDAPVVELTRDKLTWSVSDEAFKFPYIQWFDTISSELPHKIAAQIDEVYLKNYGVQNCFGTVPSIHKSDSFIVVCAHYDHLGRMGRKNYFPGANDNASGIAMMLSLAREIQQRPLQNHNVVFIAFAGEEIGLEGSSYFVNSSAMDLKTISLVLNLDILGSGEDGITVVNGSVYPQYYQSLVQLNESIPAVPVVKVRGKAANSDHYPFSEKGVPAIFIYTMGPNKNYHDINDCYEQLTFDRFENLHYLFLRFLYRF